MSSEQILIETEAAGPALAVDEKDHKAPFRRPKRLSGRTKIELVVLLGPAVFIFLAFVVFPVVMAAYYGFFKWNGFGPATDFAGFDNYIAIFQDPTFHDALKHNAFILVMSLVLQGPVALLLALLMNRKMRGQSLIRVLIFVPYVISEAIVGTGWSLMLATNGAFNGLLEKIGLAQFQQDWLANPKLAIWTLMVILVWKYVGFAVILFLAGLQGIPVELYEAAAIDGASFWQIQRTITLPLLGPTIRIWAFLSIIGSLQLFDLVYIVWGQYVSGVAGTSTMATYMALEGRMSQRYGYGNAVAVVLFLISLIIGLLYQRLILSRDTEGALTSGSAKKKEVRA